MGSKSKSSQQTSNTQSTTNVVNDGTYAGASDVMVDESETDIDDSYNTDNSTSTEIDDSYNTTNEFEDSFNTDNSVNTDFEDSFNTDNSIENDGDFAGNSGNISILDGGAIEAAQSIAETALDANVDVTDRAFDFGEKALGANEAITDKAFDFGADALDEVQTVAVSALENVTEFGNKAIDSLGDFGNEAIDSLAEQTNDFADNLSGVTRASFDSNKTILDNIGKSNTEDKALIAELARNTSLAGQDIVAKSSQKMTLYMAIAMGLGFVALVFLGRGK